MESKDIHIRKATENDFSALYELGLQTPEFKVSANGEFMEEDEFMSAIQNTTGTFLLAELDNEVVGFVYADRQDIEHAPKTKWACLVYLVIRSEFRKGGIAQKLYESCIQDLKDHGITRVYGWANSESDGSIIAFMKKNGFAEGHKYMWMDKELTSITDSNIKNEEKICHHFV